MEAAMKTVPDIGDTVTFERRLTAPRELVFKLWTDPKHLAKWWGPKGFTNPVCEFDARPGGRIYIDMTGPDGTAYPMNGTVEEIVPPERLVMRCDCCGDDSGNPGVETVTTVTFHEEAGHAEAGGTRLVVEARIVKAEDFARDALAGMQQGWNETLDRLAEALKQ